MITILLITFELGVVRLIIFQFEAGYSEKIDYIFMGSMRLSLYIYRYIIQK